MPDDQKRCFSKKKTSLFIIIITIPISRGAVILQDRAQLYHKEKPSSLSFKCLNKRWVYSVACVDFYSKKKGHFK
jgi:hypothetical protein